MPHLTTSVIIPVSRACKTFEACLSSVTAALPPPDEVIVVADGEGDGCWRMAERFGARIIHVPVNGGPARARNLGAKAAHGDVLFFVDADVTIPPYSLQIIQEFFEKEDIAALIGSYDEDPHERNFLSQFKNLFHHFVHQHGSTEASTFWGACGAIRRQVFLDIGGFDETYARPSIEDIELGYRLKAANHRIRLSPELQVKHLKRWNLGSLVTTDLFDRAVPWTELIWNYFIRRKQRVSNDLNLGITYRLSLIVSYLFVAAAIGCFLTPWSLVAVLVLGLAYTALQFQMFQFFRKKRGLPFAFRTLFWRFAYDFYSGLGFCYGSWRFAHASTRKILTHAFARLDPVALGAGVGVAWALDLWGATAVLIIKGGDAVGANLSLLSHFFPGYSVTWVGSLIGLLYGLVFGFVFGAAFARIRNFAVRCSLGTMKVRSFLARVQDWV